MPTIRVSRNCVYRPVIKLQIDMYKQRERKRDREKEREREQVA